MIRLRPLQAATPPVSELSAEQTTLTLDTTERNEKE